MIESPAFRYIIVYDTIDSTILWGDAMDGVGSDAFYFETKEAAQDFINTEIPEWGRYACTVKRMRLITEW